MSSKLTVRGTQTLVSFAPLAFKLFYPAMRARAEPFFPEPFLLDKRRVGFMRRANFLGDRRFLDLVGILLLKYLIFSNVSRQDGLYYKSSKQVRIDTWYNPRGNWYFRKVGISTHFNR